MSVCWHTDASAYEDAGHYHTLRRQWAGGAGTFGIPNLEVFCAQLPDLSRELDAKSQRLEMGILSPRWTFFSSCGDEAVSHMAISQFYVHTLTGGTASRALEAAGRTLKALQQKALNGSNEAHCAVGFALHALGDARAHQKLGSSPGEMYPTGEGHMSDSTKPDHPLFGDRSELWADYAVVMGQGSAAPDLALSNSGLAEMVHAALEGAIANDNDALAYNEEKLIKLLEAGGRDPLGCFPEDYEDSDRVCQPDGWFQRMVGTCVETRRASDVVADFGLPELGYDVDPGAAYALFLETAIPEWAAVRENGSAPAPCGLEQLQAEQARAQTIFAPRTSQRIPCNSVPRVAAELAELIEALESVRLLAELQATHSLPDEEVLESTPRMLAAAVLLVVERLRLVRKVVIGAAAAGLLEHRNNRALPPHEGDDPDVVLSSPPKTRRR